MNALQVVAAIIENEHGSVLLSQRPSGKLHAGLWELPGGKIEDGESAEQALIRELQEELKLKITFGRTMGRFHYEYESGAVDLHVFIVSANNSPTLTEHIRTFKWVNPNSIRLPDLLPADVKPFTQYLESL